MKSQAYARKNGLTEFEYVLQPKTKGFTSFVTTLRQGTYKNTVNFGKTFL